MGLLLVVNHWRLLRSPCWAEQEQRACAGSAVHSSRQPTAAARSPRRRSSRAPAATLGGSLTFGRGASKMGRTDWAALLRSWLQDAFPGAGHSLGNGAVAASPSEYMSFCLQHHLPKRPVDLVLVRAAAAAAAAAAGSS